jgi:hypothetical protein
VGKEESSQELIDRISKEMAVENYVDIILKPGVDWDNMICDSCS